MLFLVNERAESFRVCSESTPRPPGVIRTAEEGGNMMSHAGNFPKDLEKQQNSGSAVG
jgi:hypothetical protein